MNLMGKEWNAGYLNRCRGLLEALTTGQVEGMSFRLLNRKLAPGDTYLAERNVGLKLLTCAYIQDGWVVPKEMAYAYDLGECIPIELILD